VKFKALVMTLLFAAGVATSVAVAKGPPPGKGKSKGSTSSSTATSTTGTVACKPTVSFILKGEFKGSSGGARQ
jgi:hypothetical protein